MEDGLENASMVLPGVFPIIFKVEGNIPTFWERLSSVWSWMVHKQGLSFPVGDTHRDDLAEEV